MDTILQFDYSVIFWIQAHMVNPFLTPFMYGISKISSSGAIWIILGLILLGMKKISPYRAYNYDFIIFSTHSR